MKDKTPDSTEKKEDGRFKPGVSGNPSGRRKGALNKSTIAAMELLRGEAQALTRVCIERALEGDLTALKLCLERLIPPSKDHPIEMTLPKVKDVSDLPGFTQALLDAVANGTIGATEAEKISKISAAHCQSVQLAELEKRISDIEQKQLGGGS